MPTATSPAFSLENSNSCSVGSQYWCFKPQPPTTTEMTTTTVIETTTIETTTTSDTTTTSIDETTTLTIEATTEARDSSVESTTSHESTPNAKTLSTEGSMTNNINTDATSSSTNLPTLSTGALADVTNLSTYVSMAGEDTPTLGTDLTTINTEVPRQSTEVPTLSTEVPTLGREATTSNRTVPLMPGLEWNMWIPWTDCSVTCNKGTRFRLKLCAEELTVLGDCQYTLGSLSNVTISYATQWDDTCNNQSCPIDGGWAGWSPWSNCSATCEQGTTMRHRECVGTAHGGDGCAGRGQETNYCNLGECPVVDIVPPPKEDVFKESDLRPSAIGLGTMSLIIVVIELVMIMLLDCVTIAKQCRLLRRNCNGYRGRRRVIKRDYSSSVRSDTSLAGSSCRGGFNADM